MLYWILKITVISIVLVILIHHFIHYLKSTLTVPKMKDLVNNSREKYENIYNIINNSSSNIDSNINCNNNMNNTNNMNNNISTSENEYTVIDLLPTKEENNMKDELKHFLKSQLKNSNSNSNYDTNLSSFNFHNKENESYSSY